MNTTRRLTPRHLQILRLLALGHQYKSVALRLGCELNTVKAHARVIYERLDVHNAPAAVMEAVRRGYLPGNQVNT